MNGLVEFLTREIEADEAVARAAGDAEDCGGYSVEPFDKAPLLTVGPGRALAECEAKRRIVELHPPTRNYIDERAMTDPEPRYVDGGWSIPVELLLLAIPYADRPGFREEWRA